MAEAKEDKPFELRDSSYGGGSGLSPELKSWDQIRDIIHDPAASRG